MKTFRDFILAHPAADDCSGCMQPIGWRWLVNLRFLEMLRALVDDLDDITELQELIDLAGETGETAALGDCPLIWEQFIRWRRRQQMKSQLLGRAYGLSTAQ
jgi:hypothetical protein